MSFTLFSCFCHFIVIFSFVLYFYLYMSDLDEQIIFDQKKIKNKLDYDRSITKIVCILITILSNLQILNEFIILLMFHLLCFLY